MLDFLEIKEHICIPADTYREEAERWKFLDEANCYQYAICLEKDILGAIMPGEIAGVSFSEDYMYTDEDLVYYVERDMESLGMEIRPSTLEEKVTDKNSWKIAVMNVRVISMSGGYDFHFLRQNPKTGEWYQKFRGEQHPVRTDANYNVINDPATACYEDYHYQLVGYYIIRKVEQKEP